MARALSALIIGLFLIAGTVVPTLAASVQVNDSVITDMQIAQRQKMFQMERRGGGQRAVIAELVDEAIMMQEARKLGISVSEAQVNSAVQSVARNLRVSTDKLGTLLTQNGVNIETLKDRLRASIAWSGVAQQAVRSRLQISDLELEQQAAQKATPAMSFDYVLKEVIFVGSAGARTGQANQYRKSFQGCDTAVPLSTKYNDAAVVDVGRRHATQLPEAIAKELAGLNVGGITKPRTTANGVSMLAVCSKAEARDLTFITNNLRNEIGQEKMASEADKFLAELRKKANIVYN